MRTAWMRWALVWAALPGGAICGAENDPETKPQPPRPFVVTCKLKQPNEEARLLVAAVPAGKQTEIPVRFRAKSGDGQIEADKFAIIVPGSGESTTLTIGHKIQVNVEATTPDKIRLAASVEFSDADRTQPGAFRVVGHHGTFLGELSPGKPAVVVLETDDRGAPKHSVEFVVRFADERTDERAEASSRAYSVVYSVAGLVKVGSKIKAGKAPELDFAPLVKKIEAKIAPDTWASAGGEGKIQPFAPNVSLVVTQTEAVHKELAAYISRLIDDEDAIQKAIFEEE